MGESANAGREREREAPVAPRRCEEHSADDEHRDAGDGVGGAGLHQEAVHVVAVLVEDSTEPRQGVDVVMQARERQHEEEREGGHRRGEGRVRDAPSRCEPQTDGPHEELDRDGEPDQHPGSAARIAPAPGRGDEEHDHRREVRHPHLADELRPQGDDAVDPPVPDADEPEREREAREPDEHHQDIGDAGGQQGEG